MREVGRRVAMETGEPKTIGGSTEGELCLSAGGHECLRYLE